MEERIIRSARILGPLVWAALAVWLGMVIFVAPIERVQGVVQKILYVHVPCVLPAYLGFILTAIGASATCAHDRSTGIGWRSRVRRWVCSFAA